MRLCRVEDMHQFWGDARFIREWPGVVEYRFRTGASRHHHAGVQASLPIFYTCTPAENTNGQKYAYSWDRVGVGFNWRPVAVPDPDPVREFGLSQGPGPGLVYQSRPGRPTITSGPRLPLTPSAWIFRSGPGPPGSKAKPPFWTSSTMKAICGTTGWFLRQTGCPTAITTLA